MAIPDACVETGLYGRMCLSPSLPAVCLYIAYLASLAIHRLYFSPLAKFPGSKLTAVSGWYETYYQFVKRGGGQFTFKIKEWHDEYGPIIRINPHELHIHDPDFYETIYSMSHTVDKASYAKHEFLVPGSTFSSVEHELHRKRKAAISPLYSRRRVLELGPFIQSVIDDICRRLAQEYAGTGRSVRLNDLFSSYVADIATKTAFDQSYNFLDQPDFVSPFATAINKMKKQGHFCMQFPWIPRILAQLPLPVLTVLNPSMVPGIQYKANLRIRIGEMHRSVADGRGDKLQGAIFHELLNSDLPPEELSVDRLVDEAVSVVGAGIESTKWILALTFFYILDNPSILARLQRELEKSIPDSSSPPPLSELERLPWLMACVNEGLRLGYGEMTRSPRIFRDKTLQFGGWAIPPGIPVSADSWHMHHDERVFPDSFTYRPERWLGNPKGPHQGKNLSRYLTTFGKGTRVCAGTQLAMAEIVLAVASLFRRFAFALFQTDRTDVECYCDEIGPGVHPQSKGIRIVVKAEIRK